MIQKPGCGLGQGAFLELGGARLFFKECSHNSQPSEESLVRVTSLNFASRSLTLSPACQNALDRLYERSKNILQEFRATGVEPMRARSSSSNSSPRSRDDGTHMMAMSTPSTSSTPSLHHSRQYAAPAPEHVGNTSSHILSSDPYGSPSASRSNYSSFTTVGGTQMMTEMGTSGSHTFEMRPPIVPSQNDHQGNFFTGLPLDPMHSSTSTQALSSADSTGQSILSYGLTGTDGRYGHRPPEPMPYHSPTFTPYMDPASNLARFSASGEGDMNVDRQDGQKAWTGFVQQLF